MITSRQITKDIRTYLSISIYLIAWIIEIPSIVLYSISKLIKNKEDNF